MKTIIKSDIVSALKSVGLQNGDSVMVHTSLGQIGYVQKTRDNQFYRSFGMKPISEGNMISYFR